MRGEPAEQLLTCIRRLKTWVQERLDDGETTHLTASPEIFFRLPSKPAQPTPVRPSTRATAAPTGLPALDELRRAVADCQHCALGRTRTQTVFGQGDPRAELVLVGEAPGAEEDRQGVPFVGEAGKLLNRILAAIGLDREKVYICNVLKCRPPGNRNPLPEEIQACREHLTKQLALLSPKLICALGTFAAQTLLQTGEPIGKLRGRTFDLNGVPVIATLHPAAVLYHPQNKPLVWEDFKRVASLLNLPVRSKTA